MKVLYLITRADLGGAQIHLLDLLRHARRSIDSVVGVGEEGFFARAVRDLEIPCHIVPDLVRPIAPSRDVRALLQLVQLIREVKPDLVHTHTSKASFLGRCAARIAGTPCVYTAQTWCFAEGTSWKWKLSGIPCEWLAARWTSAIINVSESNRRLARRYRIAGPEKLRVIHNAVPDAPHRARPDKSGGPTIAVVARLCPQKDHGLLLQALAGIATPARALLVGDGSSRTALEAEAQRLGVSDRVEFLGNRRDVPELLSAADIFVLPTRWEGFPLSILEAMRAGLPVLASNVDGVSEAVVDGETGFLVPAGDVAALRARLQQLLESSSLRRQMGDAGRKRYELEFTLEGMLRKTLAVYRSVIRGPRPMDNVLVAPAYSSKASADL